MPGSPEIFDLKGILREKGKMNIIRSCRECKEFGMAVTRRECGQLDLARIPYNLKAVKVVFMGKRVIYMFAAAFLSYFPIVAHSSACDTACPLRHSSPWDRLVEKSIGLPRGLGTCL